MFGRMNQHKRQHEGRQVVVMVCAGSAMAPKADIIPANGGNVDPRRVPDL